MGVASLSVPGLDDLDRDGATTEEEDVLATGVDSFIVRTVVVCRLGLRPSCWFRSAVLSRSTDWGLCRSGLGRPEEDVERGVGMRDKER